MDLIVELMSGDVAKSVNFYQTTLGWELSQELKGTEKIVWAEMKTPKGSKIQFFERGQMEGEIKEMNGAKTGATAVIIFEVEDIKAIWLKHKENIEIIDGLTKKEYGTIEFKFRDPDGYIVQLTQRV